MFEIDRALRWRSRSRRRAGATADKVEQSTEILNTGSGLVVRGHGEDVVAGCPFVVLNSLLVGSSMEWELGGTTGRERGRANAILGTRAKGSGWGTRVVLIVAVIADMVPAVRHGWNGA